MTKSEFLYKAPHFIFKEVAKSVNQLSGLSKTSGMIANLFSTLPMQIEVRHMSNQPKPSKKLNALNEFVHAYVKHDDSSKVYMAFFCKSEKQLNKIYKAIEKHPTYFAYLYMREALKLTRLVNTKTHYKMMSAVISKHNSQLSKQLHYAYIIKACDLMVTEMIKNLFTNSILAPQLSKVIEGVYNNDYVSYSGKTEAQILAAILPKQDESIELDGLSDEYAYCEEINAILPTSEQGLDGEIPTDESIITNIGESVQHQFYSMSRGNGSAAIFGEFFKAEKVKTGWFKKLTAKFERDVYYITNTFESCWSSLNNTYRHKFKAPQAKYKDNKLAVVLSVDHSGSVSTEGLQKLLYLFEKHSKKITKLIVLIHDTEVVKEFVLDDEFDIAQNPNFKEALAHRFAVGGTSHFDVFKRINEMITTNEVDVDKTIYISFSDNESDIPKSWASFPKLSTMSTTFLAPYHNPMNIQGTTDISMQ